jgi:ABC-type glycerol-3-phosphate transport system substrate-binding protein
MSDGSRRDFLKIAVAGAAGAAFPPALGRAAGKTATLLHESSFIKTFDEYMQNTLAPAYEKETGVKIVYETTSVGSLPTRVSTVAETGSGADITMNIT